MTSLQALRTLLEQNSLLFFILFVLSLAANLFEIAGFFRERRQRKEEQVQRAKDEERLRVYEFLFETAQRSITTETELNQLRDEIVRRKDLIPKLHQRVRLLQLAAKREIAAQNMARTIADLRSGYEELEALKALHAELGELPDLPQSERSKIEREIGNNTYKLYELPKALTYRALLLVLVVLLLPAPADQVLVLVLLELFLRTFFEVAAQSREAALIRWVAANKTTIGFLSCFGAWYFMVREVETFLGRPLDLSVGAFCELVQRSSEGLGYPHFSFSQFLLSRSYFVSEVIMLFISCVLSLVHWRRIRSEVLGVSVVGPVQ